MGKAPPISVSLAGTRNGRLRARVKLPDQPPYHVTVGGEKWTRLPEEIRAYVLLRARRYLQILNIRLTDAMLGRPL